MKKINLKHLQSERGVILLVVLWVVIALSVLAFGFASDIQMGARSVRNSKDSASGYFLARAALNEAIFDMYKYSQPGFDPNQTALFKQQRILNQPVTLTLDTGNGQCWIENESGKFDLNAGSPLIFRNLLVLQFGLDDFSADEVIKRWTDWKNGTLETKPEMPARLLPSVESLLVLGNIRSGWVYGEWKRSSEDKPEFHRGLMDIATVYSASAQINLNAAPAEVLQAIPGVDASQAEAIIRARRQGFFKDVDDCQQRTPIQFNDAAKNLVTVSDSAVFTLLAKGQPTDSSFERKIRAIVRIGSSDPLGYRILYWNDEEI